MAKVLLDAGTLIKLTLIMTPVTLPWIHVNLILMNCALQIHHQNSIEYRI